MADLSITPANVLRSTGQVVTYKAGAGYTAAAGDLVYLDTGTTTLLKALSDSAVHATALGVTLNGGGPGQPIQVQTSGDLTLNSCMTVGQNLTVSSNAAKIADIGDLGSGDFVFIVGTATTTTNLTLILTGGSTVVAVP